MKKNANVGLSILCGVVLSVCILSGLTFAFALATMSSAGSFYPTLISGGVTLLLVIIYAVIKLLIKIADNSSKNHHSP